MRKILMSVLIVAAMAALVGGATLAPFTSEKSDTGTVTAGTVSLSALVGGGSLLFTGAPIDCDVKVEGVVTKGLLGAGDSCTATVTGTYTGTLAADVSVVTTPSTACFTIVDSWTDPTAVAPGGPIEYTVTVTVINTPVSSQAAVDACQGASVSVTTTVTATQS